ncbi:hypothetical protein [Azotosporobacter soli]|uniref:hypothetical protein n=1 Tax=Azotosporobacter soli TaxID=3055040 RepID=UPI0031FE9161
MEHAYQKHKILVLNGSRKRNAFVNVAEIYKPMSAIARCLQRLHEHLPICGEEIWYEDWKKEIENYDTVILFDGLRGPDIIKYIHRKNPQIRIVIYYVNKFSPNGRNHPRNFRHLPCELWSFDKNDCEEHGMKHSRFCYDDMFANEEILAAYEKGPDPQAEFYDAFFIGVDKNRLKKVIELKKMLEGYQYRTKIVLKKARQQSYKECSLEELEILTEQGVSYAEVVKMIWQTKVIIELEDTGQNGLTLRSLESLFFKKKLITDNSEIRSYAFYQPENIFILGLDKEERLKEFLQSAYQPVADEVVQEYTWERWLDRFYIELENVSTKSDLK